VSGHFDVMLGWGCVLSCSGCEDYMGCDRCVDYLPEGRIGFVLLVSKKPRKRSRLCVFVSDFL
jgi:hypothetical protein